MSKHHPGLRKDATHRDFPITLAMLNQKRRLMAHGRFHAHGHVLGRRYQERIGGDGTISRCWLDGQVEPVYAPPPPTPRPSTILRGSRWVTYHFDDLPDLPDSPGVYVVYSSLWIIYVGVSSSLAHRWRSHRPIVVGEGAGGGQILEHRAWGRIGEFRLKVRVDKRFGEGLAREARLIRRLRPEFNKRGVQWGGARP